MLMTEDFDTNEDWHRAMILERKLKRCPDCGCGHGEKHHGDCDVQRCGVCGKQQISCGCRSHDSAKTLWMGVWPTVS